MESDIGIAMLSRPGPRPENQDAVGARLPGGPLRRNKGMAFAIADGASVAEAGRIAAESCVKNFLGDYFATPDSWSVKRSGGVVLDALNRWLLGQGLRFGDPQRGCVSTFTGCVLHGRNLHVFHVGDTRLYRFRQGVLERLTRDHRAQLSDGQPVLTRAMGLDHRIDIDYSMEEAEAGDVYLLLTDGIHDRIGQAALERILAQSTDPESLCANLISSAEEAGSDDNASAVVVFVHALPEPGFAERLQEGKTLALLPLLSVGDRIDGLLVEEIVAESPRSQVYRVRDESNGLVRILKSPSPRCEDIVSTCHEFSTENWVLRRVQHPRLPRGAEPPKPRSALYVLMEPADGEPLRVWMQRHRQPPVGDALQLTRQVAQAVRALHRHEILHRDIRPENILVDANGQATLIDLGQCRVAGLAESGDVRTLPGAQEYAAPEYSTTPNQTGHLADQFSLGALLYEMLTGCLPFEQGRFHKLRLQPASSINPMVPAWVDALLARALAIDPAARFGDIAEFADALTRPVATPLHPMPARKPSLLERDPCRFWQLLACLLAATQLLMLVIWIF